MTARELLSNRRACTTFAFQCNGLAYIATVSRYGDDRLAEIFISNAKAGSHSDAAAKDAAVVCSIALQHNVPTRGTIQGWADPIQIQTAIGIALEDNAEYEQELQHWTTLVRQYSSAECQICLHNALLRLSTTQATLGQF